MKGRAKSGLLLLAIGCGLSAFSAAVRAQEMVLPLEPAELHLRVTVEVNGKPALLIVDTGAAFTHLDSRFLKLPRARRSLRITTGADEAELRVLEPVKLLIADSRQPTAHKTFDIETLDIDLAAQRRACACDIAGVLGLDVLRRFDAVTLDFRNSKLELTRQKKGTANERR